MAVRAKFKLTQITHHHWMPTGRTLRFDAQYDQSIPEDQRFHEATPTGHFEMFCTNPVVLEQLQLGQNYYFDIAPAE